MVRLDMGFLTAGRGEVEIPGLVYSCIRLEVELLSNAATS